MGQDDFFNDLDDLEETPSFDMGIQEDPFPFDEEPEDGKGGVSRTFKIVGAVLLIAVLIIAIVLIAYALTSGNELTSNQQTGTAAILTNTAVQSALNQTTTAIAVAVTATSDAIQTQEFNATQTEVAFQTVQAQQTLDAAATATAEFIASQTAAAIQTATQDALNIEATATAEANILSGRVVGEGNVVFGNVTIRLYRDDGDGQFNPQSVAEAPTPTPASPGGEAPVVELTPEAPTDGGGEQPQTGSKPLAYGETKEGAVPEANVDRWTFNGTAGDVVTIHANASDTEQMDMFLQLLGPDDTLLIDDDDSGGDFNAAVLNFVLPTTGQYAIEVDSVAAPGPYTISLTLESVTAPPTLDEEVPTADVTEEVPVENIDAPTPETGGVSSIPFARIVPREEGAFRYQDGPTPTPEGDTLIDTLVTGPDGSFDFGVLEPGEYWIQIDYDSLPSNLQALVPGGPTSDMVLLYVNVPTAGEVTFTVMSGPTYTPTPTTEVVDSAGQTATSLALTQIAETPGVVITLTPTAEMPQSGLFSADEDGNIDSKSGLTVLAIAAAGLVAVVFIARRLRTAR